MITDADRYYGAAFNKIIESSDGGVSIERLPKLSAGFFLINQRTPVYIKYSTERRSPWQFNFHRQQQLDQQRLFEEYGECLVALVCGKDGIASLRHSDFRSVLDNHFEPQESVSVRRRLREMYRIRGKDGTFERKVARSSLETLLSNAGNDS